MCLIEQTLWLFSREELTYYLPLYDKKEFRICALHPFHQEREREIKNSDKLELNNLLGEVYVSTMVDR
jgi:hypothetical protein